MTTLQQKAPTPVGERPLNHALEWIVGVVGAIAAAIGVWLYYGPSAGELSLFGWDWDVSGLHEAWPFSLMIGGGLLLFAAFAVLARRLFMRDKGWTAPVSTSAVLALAALAGAVTYTLIWVL